MPDPIDPPRPSLRSGVQSFLAGCTWNQSKARVEDSSGNAIVAWLNQTGTPGLTATVQWDAGTSSQAGTAVDAVISSESFTIIDGGTYDSNTGLMTYQNKTYRFALQKVSGVVTMAAYSV